jgi:hypothetical protein
MLFNRGGLRNCGGLWLGTSLLTLSMASSMQAIDKVPPAPRPAETSKAPETVTPQAPSTASPPNEIPAPPAPVVHGPATRMPAVEKVSREGDEVGSSLPARTEASVESGSPSKPDAPVRESVRTARVEKRPADVPDTTPVQPKESAGPVAEPAPPPAALSAEMIDLRDKIRRTLEVYHPRQLNTRDHNAWEVMHSIIAYGVDSNLNEGGPTGKNVNSAGWLCYNNPCKGDRMLYLDRGKPAARQGVGVQGHHGQFLAILGQSKVMRDFPVRVSGQDFTLEDLIETEKLGCLAGTELTFKLIALAHYLDSDATWKNFAGQDWSIPRLIQEEIKQPIRGAACGGTHRLMGLSYAVRKRQQKGGAIEGQFLRAQKYTNDYHQYTLSLQNPDGSFSTEWFSGRGNRLDTPRRLQTTGHILEWMAYSMTPEMLQDPRLVKAADYLSGILLNGQGNSWEIGPLGHALHALALYNERVFKAQENAAQQTVAQRPKVEDDQPAAKPTPPENDDTQD